MRIAFRVALMGSCVAFAGAASAQGIVQAENQWFKDGQAALAAAEAVTPITTPARNVILFVGDGYNLPSIFAARVFEGQLAGGSGEEYRVSFEKMPYAALSKTYNTDKQVPDSAGTMTAMMSGVKSYFGAIGVDGDATRGDCASAEGRDVTSLLESAEVLGMATGVVTTARITHATPAATYAHTPERNWEDDKDLTDEALANGCVDIARQLVEFPLGDGIDIAMGGGRRSFFPAETADLEDEGKSGERQDGRNLTQEWVDGRDGAAFVYSADQLAALDPATTGPVLGLFDRSHLEYEADRADDVAGEPSLAEMTEFAIKALSRDDDGYFLMVEGGRIDHANHATNAGRMVTDAVAFNKAVQAAMDMTNEQDTLIVVTADHGHAIAIAGYPARGNPILGLSKSNTGELNVDANGQPYTTIGYLNGAGPRPELQVENTETGIEAIIARPDLTNVDTQDIDFLQEALVPRSSETHSGEDVGIFAQGPSAYLFQGVVEQNFIYHVMARALRIEDRLGQ